MAESWMTMFTFAPGVLFLQKRPGFHGNRNFTKNCENLNFDIPRKLLSQNFSNFMGLLLTSSAMILCKKIGIGWTNFFSVAMETKKEGFLLTLDFCESSKVFSGQ